MRVLAVDTTGPRGSLAVASEDGVLAEARVAAAGGHSRWLLGAVDALLAGLGLEAGTIDVFAVTTGPGSFTGLRVGLGSVQGLALASGRPCVGLSALEVLALGVAGVAPTVAVLVDAFRGEVFSGVFDGAGAPLREPGVGSLASAVEGLPPGTAFVGDAVAGCREAIRSAVAGAAFPAAPEFLAPTLAAAALRRARAGAVVPASALRPLYLRGADIRRARP